MGKENYVSYLQAIDSSRLREMVQNRDRAKVNRNTAQQAEEAVVQPVVEVSNLVRVVSESLPIETREKMCPTCKIEIRDDAYGFVVDRLPNGNRALPCPVCSPRVKELKQRKHLQEGMQKMFNGSGIPENGREWSFGNYPQEGDLEAKEECLAFAAKEIDARGLYLYGGLGRGKSGLAISILKAFLERNESGLYIRAAKYLRLVQRWTLRREDEKMMDLAYGVTCLVLDDLGVESPTEAAVRQFYELVEERRGQSGLYTIITSNHSLEALEDRWRPQGVLPGEFHDGLRVVDRLRESWATLEVVGSNLRTEL